MSTYAEFLKDKIARVHEIGIAVDESEIPSMLHDWQKEIVVWACSTGRAAIWADTGLGKTFMQVAWADVMRSNGSALIVAPLAVCAQTVRESAKIGVTATYCRDASEMTGPGVYVTNYEMVEHFAPELFNAVVLDEASILKNSNGSTRNMLIAHFESVPYRLACTATPAPNDPEELTSQAEFLGHMTRSHMLAAYFIHDSDGWRLKGHARAPMLKWMATWATAIRKPSDMGYPDDGYILPGLEIVSELIPVEIDVEGQLFATDLGGVSGRAMIRRETLAARVQRAVDLVESDTNEPWILWCGLNSEAEALAKAIPGAVNVHGGLTPEQKAAHLLDFADGGIRVLITKPGIASQGLNYQHCARMAFVGLSDSYEQYYQSIRRCYRYGQKRIVRAHVVLSELESQIATNVQRKEKGASALTAALVSEMRTNREVQTA